MPTVVPDGAKRLTHGLETVGQWAGAGGRGKVGDPFGDAQAIEVPGEVGRRSKRLKGSLDDFDKGGSGCGNVPMLACGTSESQWVAAKIAGQDILEVKKSGLVVADQGAQPACGVFVPERAGKHEQDVRALVVRGLSRALIIVTAWREHHMRQFMGDDVACEVCHLGVLDKGRQELRIEHDVFEVAITGLDGQDDAGGSAFPLVEAFNTMRHAIAMPYDGVDRRRQVVGHRDAIQVAQVPRSSQLGGDHVDGLQHLLGAIVVTRFPKKYDRATTRGLWPEAESKGRNPGPRPAARAFLDWIRR